MLESYTFFSRQIVQAILAGVMLASVGMFVVLRRMIFVGLTTAQASAMCYAGVLVFGLSTPLVLPLSFGAMLPLLLKQRAESSNREAALASAFVLFFAGTEVLVSLGSRAEMHVVQAFSGNVLNMPELPWALLVVLCVGFLVLFAACFRLFSRVFFDRDCAQLHGDRVQVADLLFFALLVASASLGTMLLGATYTMAHLIIPGAAVVPLARSMRASWIGCMVVSTAGTLAGFSLSFLPWNLEGEIRHLPSSSAVIACLGCLYLLLRLVRALRRFKRL